MAKITAKLANRQRRKNRIRSVIRGSAKRPRLSVFISLNHISAQLVDDDANQTIVYTTTVGQKQLSGSMTDKAKWVGQDIALKAKAKKLNKVVFDRNGKLYHGRVAALADAARESGLEI